MKEIKVTISEKFKKELKKYSKKYSSIYDDLIILEKVIIALPKGNKSKHWNMLKHEGEKYIFKIRMACKSLGKKSFRVIYFFDGEIVELVFLEIYFKGNKEREDQKIIEEFWKIKNNL